MEHIILLFFSFFTEAVILWQYASSLFTSSYSNKIKLAAIECFLCYIVSYFPARTNRALMPSVFL